MARVEGPTRKQMIQAVVMGECGYCGKAVEIDNKLLPLECVKCKGLYHVSCLRGEKPPVLLGDQLWVFTCAFCDPLGQESCERPNLQWVHVTHLALYNLIVLGKGGRNQFFRWNEDICGFIQDNWVKLMPHRKKTQSWHSTVAGTLSVNCPSVFRSGNTVFREHGWWSLTSLVPPNPAHIISNMSLGKRSTTFEPTIKPEPPVPKRLKSSLRQKRGLVQVDNTFQSVTPLSLSPTPIGRSKEPQLLLEQAPKPMFTEPTNPNLVRMSERQENVLLEHFSRYKKSIKKSPVASRLVAKLKVRSRQRKYGRSVFDLDSFVADSISLTQNYVVNEKLPYYEQVQPVLHEENVPDDGQSSHDQSACETLDRFSPIQGNEILDQLTLLPVLSSALVPERTRFEHYLVGNTASTQLIHSPYTVRMLKPYIFKSTEMSTRKMKLNKEIIQYHNTHSPNDHIIPFKAHSIDFCYLQEHHIPAVNNLVSCFFWPVDLSECLQYPDFTCVVLCGKLMVGCAFMTPDVKVNEAYISFLLVHPDFQNCGIGKTMVYHLIQSCAGKDVTLHVSVDNTAMLLYQKFGFKAEKYCLDFYERYYPSEHHLSKHAYFMRLRR